jgi:hypothetical protein
MEKVYIVFWTFIFDVEDYDCKPQTSMVGIYSTEELAKQKIADIVNSTKEEKILSYDEYISELGDGYGEIDYSNYLYDMRDTSSSSYHYEEWSVLEQWDEKQ